MKTRLLLSLVFAFCTSFMMLHAGVPVSPSVLDNDDDTETSVSLNDIRFANFSDADWLDNDYIRSLRLYLDEVATKKAVNENLEPYLDVIKGKFVILNIEPALMGGAFIYIAFVDHPKDMFVAWVYSEVDPKTNAIGPYETRMVAHDDQPLDLTTEHIMQIVKEHPEIKLW